MCLREAMKTHNRESFYKYCTAEALMSILESRKLRWSSPSRFNDPFDHQLQISMAEDSEDNKTWFLSQSERVVFGESEPKVVYPGPYTESLLLLRKHASELGRAEVMDELTQGYEEGLVRGRRYLDGLNQWWKLAMQKARIFCVSEEPQDLLMWAHYSGEHSGAVVELRCIEAIDSCLCAARKVEYRTMMPKLGSYRDVLMSYLGLAPEPSSENLYFDLAFVKSNHWSYEKEWRCINPFADEACPYSDYTFHPEEIASVCLGCRMQEKEEVEIMRLLATGFPHVQVFKMQVDDREYRLIPRKINILSGH